MSPFGIGVKEIASVDVPGEGHIGLPAGKVRLRYAEDRDGRSTEGSNCWRGPDETLAVSVSTGERELAIKKPRMVNEGASRGVIHKDLGSIELDAPSECVVRVAMSSGTGERPNPRIIFRA